MMASSSARTRSQTDSDFGGKLLRRIPNCLHRPPDQSGECHFVSRAVPPGGRPLHGRIIAISLDAPGSSLILPVDRNWPLHFQPQQDRGGVVALLVARVL